MSKKVLVVGGGMVGEAMAMDLAADHQVTLADNRPARLTEIAQRWKVATLQADLGRPATVTDLAARFDLVLGALPSRIGLQTLRAVIEAGRPFVDISFMADDPLQLDALARERGVCAVVDCGVAPGMSNMLCGWAAATMRPCERLAIYVGGVPVERRWPWEYKAGFAPSDVLEEYVRPSREVEDGRVVVKVALSEPELLDFPGLGTLEAFCTDGLRSLATTLKVPWMKEKTMRYPGHIALMRVLRETGFFSETPVEVGGQKVVPLALTSALLFPHWTYGPGEDDLTVMRVIAEGVDQGRRVRRTWDLFDRRDAASDLRSMSRTTAFPATIMARLILEGRFSRPGVHPPEVPGAEPGLLELMLAEHERRGVRYTCRVEPLTSR